MVRDTQAGSERIPHHIIYREQARRESIGSGWEVMWCYCTQQSGVGVPILYQDGGLMSTVAGVDLSPGGLLEL